MAGVRVRQETFSLSGFGGGYEDQCQRMLWRGVAYLAEVKPPMEMWKDTKEFQNVYGITAIEGEHLKDLEEAIIKKGDDVTGAMHQCVMGHLRFIHQNGTDKWREELAYRRGPTKAFVWEGEL